MRKIVFQMNTTLNGRLDDPMAWLHGVGEDQYRKVDSLYASYDTILVGRTTYEGMAAHWPDALAQGSETNRSVARRMRDHRKLVFSRSGRETLTAWNNVEQVAAADDEALAAYLNDLKAQPGRDLHLAGGASFAKAVVGLGLVDAFHVFVYPAISPGEPWFARLVDTLALRLEGNETYENGVAWLHYVPREAVDASPKSFTELLN
jgi:dihydrofolate reductase